ncbi:cupin domain-containing protein [Martelella endophytica]|uniref:cupin domain-containing protein n=1 Tax=Martelella endophytica TaxID=1486262 RepID=UPI000697077B|nr:cupin domain-containing protein [Martelella endophytica]
MFDRPVVRHDREVPEEVVEVGNKKRARFRMLFSADRTETHSLTCGIANLDRDNPLPLHRHAHAEIYIGLSGEAEVKVKGQSFRLSEGTAVFIPGNLEHAVHSGSNAKLLFMFSADSYQDVHYVYLDDD